MPLPSHALTFSLPHSRPHPPSPLSNGITCIACPHPHTPLPCPPSRTHAHALACGLSPQGLALLPCDDARIIPPCPRLDAASAPTPSPLPMLWMVPPLLDPKVKLLVVCPFKVLLEEQFSKVKKANICALAFSTGTDIRTYTSFTTMFVDEHHDQLSCPPDRVNAWNKLSTWAASEKMPIVLLSATAPPSLENRFLQTFWLDPNHTAFLRSMTNRPEIGFHVIHLTPPTADATLARFVHALLGRLKDKERILVFFTSCTLAESFARDHNFAVYHSKLMEGEQGKKENMVPIHPPFVFASHYALTGPTYLPGVAISPLLGLPPSRASSVWYEGDNGVNDDAAPWSLDLSPPPIFPHPQTKALKQVPVPRLALRRFGSDINPVSDLLMAAHIEQQITHADATTVDVHLKRMSAGSSKPMPAILANSETNDLDIRPISHQRNPLNPFTCPIQNRLAAVAIHPPFVETDSDVIQLDSADMSAMSDLDTFDKQRQEIEAFQEGPAKETQSLRDREELGHTRVPAHGLPLATATPKQNASTPAGSTSKIDTNNAHQALLPTLASDGTCRARTLSPREVLSLIYMRPVLPSSPPPAFWVASAHCDDDRRIGLLLSPHFVTTRDEGQAVESCWGLRICVKLSSDFAYAPFCGPTLGFTTSRSSRGGENPIHLPGSGLEPHIVNMSRLSFVESLLLVTILGPKEALLDLEVDLPQLALA
ncbi:hypothetical protein L210DRAFT_3651281 [Boletus edulis BED1]|uniref:Uncharacterized protein n=1 Tax=Boletus edulis BED1 TaxID=1328754 RepID=A0AAD4BIN5_BOLED|nr:hypothetical protein L210DRAFT_3651281 [Boletus edulis BED1]